MAKQNQIFLVLLLGSLSAFGPFILDLYLPSLPQISEFFSTPASMAQLTLTSAMIGLSVGQLLLGPISDKFGRRKPLLISLVLYVISSVLIVFSPNIETFIVLRAVQGLTSAGSVVISRAVATDLYSGREMTRFFGLLMTVNGIAPIISPIFGSMLLAVTDWRGIFVALTLLGVLVWIFSLPLRESLPIEKRLQGSTFASFGVFGKILRNRRFMLFTALEAALFGAFFGYLSSSAFIFQQSYGLSSLQYSLCFAANGTAMMLGANLAGRMTNPQAVSRGVALFLVATIYTAISLLGHFNVWLVELGFWLMLFSIGLIMAPASALAMDAERQYAGSASALLGFFPFFLGAIVSPLVGIGDIFIATSIVILFFAVIAVGLYAVARKGIE